MQNFGNWKSLKALKRLKNSIFINKKEKTSQKFISIKGISFGLFAGYNLAYYFYNK